MLFLNRWPSPALPWFELARFRRSRVTRLAVLAVLAVPLFYGGLYVWANLNPTGHLDQVKAAVVNEDELIQIKDRDGKDQPVAVGRQLAGNLISNDSDNNYDWQLTDARDAQRGLANGEYKAVLTIPKDLSKAATSTGGDPVDAVQGNLDLQTNDAVNYVNGAIADTILKAAKSALNAQVTETYLDNIYLSFSDIRVSLLEAGDGAATLADGSDKLAGGAGDLADGAATLADGNRQLATGAGQLEDGAGQLATGLQQLKSGTATLPSDTKRLADGAQQVADGTAQINNLVKGLTAGISGSTGDAKARIGQLAAALRTLAEQCRAADSPTADCDTLAAAAEQAAGLAGAVDSIAGQANGFAGQTQQLADGAQQVADGNAKLAASVPQLVGAIGQASDGADLLATGAAKLTTGANAAAQGAGKLADGGTQLADGATDLSAGALKLSTGLSDGGKQVPDYDKDERERLSETAATPIKEASQRINPVSNNGEALAPYFMALALWVGAMAIYLLLRPLSDRAIASTAGSIRTALAGYAPGLALSMIQALLLVAVIEGALGIRPANQLLMIGVALMAGAVFTAINQMFVALFGGAGRFAALVFVCLQLTAAGGTYPIETAPSFFGFLHGLLPMTYVVDGFRAATAGGSQGVGSDFFALTIFTLLALSVTIIAARRRQTVKISRLHPTVLV